MGVPRSSTPPSRPRGRFRRDADELWGAFALSLSRYLSGLALAGLAAWSLGVPYPLPLGAWVAVTSVVPYVGAFAGAVPAVVLALFVSPTSALLVALAYLAIQQLEGNYLTPKIQGDALGVHPLLVFLAVVAGGDLAGLLGVILAVPALAVLRVLFDFFRARLRTKPRSR